MKKLLSVLLAAVLVFSLSLAAFAEAEDKLAFNSDGSFKIMQINDTQDVGKNCDEKLIEFIEAALDTEKPDLVVFVGDQLSDFYPAASKKDYIKAIDNIVKPLADRDIPFLVTLGNHDHDRASVMSEAEMFEVYSSYANCAAVKTGCDPFTYNVPVLTSDGDDVAFNIYMMDTNNTIPSGGYAGITAEQLAWYNGVSAALKAENDGEPMPSLLFQHIPVKEIYSLMKPCEWDTDGAVFSRRDKTWYILDETKASGALGEAPCSEDFDNITGQYQAWLENGDIMGAFFAHDHVNNFVGTTSEGITMGYNGGSGFRSYGVGSDRSVRVFELQEDDVENYKTRIVTYEDVTGKTLSFVPSDLLSPALLTTLMRVVYALFGWMIKAA